MAKTNTHNPGHDTSLPLVIVNPGSASGSTHSKWPQTASLLSTHFGPFNVEFTSGPHDAIDIAESAAKAGRSLIIACGGDGTINEVANGILRSGFDAELGVLPSGTGGDFRRTLGMSLSIAEAAAELKDGETRRMDVGRVHFVGHDGERAERYFLNVSSFGLAASVIKRVKSAKLFDWLPSKAIRGRANFALSTLQEVMDVQPVSICVKIDDQDEKTLQTINFCIANARYFGGGMMIAPEAKIDDGEFDIVNIGDITTAKILVNAHTLYRGTHHSLAEVNSTLARKVEVAALDPAAEVLIETDGEMPGRLPAAYEIVPAALSVRVPRGHGARKMAT